jgi:hypothetical protein
MRLPSGSFIEPAQQETNKKLTPNWSVDWSVMEWSVVEWNGVEWMEWNEMEWNGGH